MFVCVCVLCTCEFTPYARPMGGGEHPSGSWKPNQGPHWEQKRFELLLRLSILALTFGHTVYNSLLLRAPHRRSVSAILQNRDFKTAFLFLLLSSFSLPSSTFLTSISQDPLLILLKLIKALIQSKGFSTDKKRKPLVVLFGCDCFFKITQELLNSQCMPFLCWREEALERGRAMAALFLP